MIFGLFCFSFGIRLQTLNMNIFYIIHDGSEKNEKICNKAKKGKENDSYMSFWKNLSQV